MTVNDLINKLLRFPPDLKVITLQAEYKENDRVVDGVEMIYGSRVLITSHIEDTEGR